MNTPHFFITGGDNLVLYHETSSNGCVLWADRYTKDGDFGGHPYLKLWEWSEYDEDHLVSTLWPATDDTPQHWEDAK